MPGAEWTLENISYAMCFFPWTGGVIGAVTWGIWELKEWAGGQGIVFGDFFWTALLVLVPLMITGGIHMDGFLDTQDARSSYQPRERKLEILKDAHTGAFAVISCGVYLLAYAGIYSSLTEESVKVIAVSFVLSRTLSGISVLCFPQAREKGLAATFSENAAKRTGKVVLGIYLVLLCAGIVWIGKISGVICLAAAAMTFLYYYRMSVKIFGGITGDLAGYFLQLCEIFMAAAVVVSDVAGKGMGVWYS